MIDLRLPAPLVALFLVDRGLALRLLGLFLGLHLRLLGAQQEYVEDRGQSRRARRQILPELTEHV